MSWLSVAMTFCLFCSAFSSSSVLAENPEPLCRKALSSPRHPLQADLLAVRDEILAQRPQPDLSGWQYGAVLKSIQPLRHLKRLRSEAQRLKASIAQNPPEHHGSLLNSLNTLDTYLSGRIRRYAKEGITYGDFLKLGLLYSAQFELALPRENNRLAVWSRQTDGSQTWLMSSQEDIRNFLKRPEYRMQFSDQWQSAHILINFDVLSGPDHLIVALPSFTKMGFESMLWLQSRGLGILGQSTGMEGIDGLLYGPFRYFAHDVGHNRIFAFGEAPDPVFWDRLSSQIDSSSGSDVRERKLKFALLFYWFHEHAQPMNCNGARQGAVQGRSYARFFDTENDLGLAFKDQPIDQKEIDRVYARLRRDIVRVCGSLDSYLLAP